MKKLLVLVGIGALVFWLVKDRTDVCGTIDMNAPDQRPDDAQVPGDIWVGACNTN